MSLGHITLMLTVDPEIHRAVRVATMAMLAADLDEAAESVCYRLLSSGLEDHRLLAVTVSTSEMVVRLRPFAELALREVAYIARGRAQLTMSKASTGWSVAGVAVSAWRFFAGIRMIRFAPAPIFPLPDFARSSWGSSIPIESHACVVASASWSYRPAFVCPTITTDPSGAAASAAAR